MPVPVQGVDTYIVGKIFEYRRAQSELTSQHMSKHTERTLALVPCTLAMTREGMGPGSQLTNGPESQTGLREDHF